MRTADFASKDGLASGTALKALKGTELGLEFDNIATMSATKVDSASNASLLSLVLTGSTVPSNGIYLSAANTLGFSSNSTLRATVNSTGNWNFVAPTSGIGVTVVGAAGALQQWTDGTRTAAVFTSGASASFGSLSNHAIGLFVNNGSNALQITTASVVQAVDDGGTLQTVGWRDMPLNAQSAPYTLVLADRGKMIRANAGCTTVTIPANASVAFPDGATIVIVNNTGGNISIAITTDTLFLAGTTTTGTRTLANNGIATVAKAYTSTQWSISGPGVS